MAGISSTLYRIRAFTRRLWVRTTLISLLAAVAALAAEPLAPFLPAGLAAGLGGDAVPRVLEILASSMLAVTIFSLSVMVAVRQSAASQTTPRSHRLLQEDPTTQTVLATFVGAFVFSLISLVVVLTGFYGDRATAVIMIATLVVIALVVTAMLRWIDHLSDLGSVTETISRAERAAGRALRMWQDNPCLGGSPLSGDADIPGEARQIAADRTGYVQHVDVPMLSNLASEGRQIHVLVQPGDLVAAGSPVLRASAGVDPDRASAGIVIGDRRDFEQDPRFAVRVLSEIGQKALSPGINDPGTALDTITAMLRLLVAWESRQTDAPRHPDVHVAPVPLAEIVRAGFDPLARDGADKVEVQVALQEALGLLARHPDQALAAAAEEAAGRARDFAARALSQDDHEGRAKAAHDRTPQAFMR